MINQAIGQCLMCPEGTYQPLQGRFECLSCPTGYMTVERGTKDIANCILGKANNFVSAHAGPNLVTFSNSRRLKLSDGTLCKVKTRK